MIAESNFQECGSESFLHTSPVKKETAVLRKGNIFLLFGRPVHEKLEKAVISSESAAS